MKLNMLVIEGNKRAEKVNDLEPVRFQSYHVVEIFMFFLSKIDLDGSSKLTIYFEKRPSNKKKYVCDNYFHVSWYYVNESDIELLNSLEKSDKDEYFLNVIVKTLKSIAEINHCNQEIFEEIDVASQKVLDSGFKLKREIKKLSKISQDKRFRAKVYRNIDNQGELWYVEIEDKDGNIYRHDLMDGPSHISKVDFFKKSQWKDNRFVISNRLDYVVATVAIDQY